MAQSHFDRALQQQMVHVPDMQMQAEAERRRAAEIARQHADYWGTGEDQQQREEDLNPFGLAELQAETTVTGRTRELRADGKDWMFVKQGQTDKLSGLYREMEKSKKYKKENSASYQAVKRELGALNATIRGISATDRGDSLRELVNDLAAQYTKVMSVTGDYLEKHQSPHSRLGRHRKFLVSQIHQIVGEDQGALLNTQYDFGSMSKDERQALTVDGLLQHSRALEVREDRDTVRVETTELYGERLRVEVNSEEGEHRGLVYFRADRVLHSKQEDNPEEEQRMASAMKNVGADPQGGFYHVEKRMAATSVLAGLLQMDGLVVSARHAKLVPKSGRPQFGVLMGEAKGLSAEDVMEADFTLKQTPEARQYARAITDPSQLGALHHNLNNLQILDMLCGQMDRHMDSYKVEIGEEDQVLGVQGVGNVVAFGTKSPGEYHPDYMTPVPVNQSALFYHPDGSIAMKYASYEMALKVQDLYHNSEVLDTALLGLLTTREIASVKARLYKLYAALSAMSRENRLLEDHQWTAGKAVEELGAPDRCHFEKGYFERFYRTMIQNDSVRQAGAGAG